MLGAFAVRSRWSVGELATHLALPKSTVHRLLATLCAFHYVSQDHADSSYVLGSRLARLASGLRQHDTIAYAAQPALQKLVAETNESAFLTVREGLRSLCVARLNAHRPIAVLTDVGLASPLHLGASNTVLLAFMPLSERNEILLQTVSDADERAAVGPRLVRIVSDGFAYSTSQLTPGASALGVPVLDETGRAVACLSLGAPTFRFERSRAMAVLPTLKVLALEIEHRLGLVGTPQ